MRNLKTRARLQVKVLFMAVLFSLALFHVPITAWAEGWAMATRINEEGLVYLGH